MRSTFIIGLSSVIAATVAACGNSSGGTASSGGSNAAGGSAGTGGYSGSGGSATGGSSTSGGTAGSGGGGMSGAGGADPAGPCADLHLPCFDIFDMWIFNPDACKKCNAGKGCQTCVIPFAQ